MGTIIPLADFELEAVDGVPVAHLSGEIDRTNSDELGGRMADAISAEGGGLVVDLTKLTFIDSTGMRMLFELAAELKRRSQALRIVVPEGAHLGDILETVGLDQAAGRDHTVGQAVAALTSSE